MVGARDARKTSLRALIIAVPIVVMLPVVALVGPRRGALDSQSRLRAME